MLNVPEMLGTKDKLVPRILLYLTIIVSSLLVFPQSTRGERLPIKIYTSADGLGSSFVDFVMRDSHGFMWFGTRDGLSRFDGAQFVTYRIDEKNSRPGIEFMAETRDGSYWVTTTGGLYRVRGNALSQAGQPLGRRPLLNAEFISSARGYLMEGRDGTLWYASGSLFQISKQDSKFSLLPFNLNLPTPPQGLSIARMTEARDGSLWLDTSVGLVRRLPDGRIVLYQSEANPAGQFRSIISEDREGRVWLIRDLDFFVVKQEPLEALSQLGALTVRSLTPTYTLPANTEMPIRLPEKGAEILKFSGGEFLSSYPGHRLFQSSDGHIWLTTNKALVEFDGKVFHRFTTAQGLPDGMLALAEDSAGNIWVGGQTALARLDRKGLVSYGEADGLHSPSISAINEASDGSLYFADADLYLNRLSGRSFVSTRPGLAPNARVLWMSHYALLDRGSGWWILTNNKLYRFGLANDRNPMATYTSRDGLKADAMFQIFEDSKGHIWVSVQPLNSDHNGLGRFDPATKRFHNFTESEGFPSGKSVSSFAEERDGTLWFGFYEGGLARFKNNQFSIFSSVDLPGGVITDLLIDHANKLWLSSSGGGVRIVENPDAESLKFTHLTTGEGLSSNNVRTITEDNLGNIYLGSVRGIDRISANTRVIKHYSVADGLAGDFVVDSHCDRNGVLWFATTSGVSRLVPTVDESYAPPPILLGGLRIAGVSQSLPELGANEVGPLELQNSQNNLQVDFFGLDFHAGENLRYQYWLEGADGDWSAPTEQRSITFANLRSGNYRFLVRALNAQGVSSGRPAFVSFRILSPIWLRWWFIALVFLGVATIGLIVIKEREGRRRERELAQLELRRAQEARLRDLEQVRRRIAADLHDDIGSNLTRISLISEVAGRKIDGSEPAIKDHLHSIGKLSRELVDSMSEIVWAINPNKDHFSDLSQRMRHFASDLLTARQIHFRFRTIDVDQDIKVGANVRREFFLIFKEGINNIARHAQCSEVEIELHAADNRLILTLKDNGKGFDAGTQAMGHGLVSMRERTCALGGELEIMSAIGQGTNLKFSIPLEPERGRTSRPT
jgi:signal transduction histidine kinase/ligand-binding sensor domain-containing protein